MPNMQGNYIYPNAVLARYLFNMIFDYFSQHVSVIFTPDAARWIFPST